MNSFDPRHCLNVLGGTQLPRFRLRRGPAVRKPSQTRPWQFSLAALFAFVALAAILFRLLVWDVTMGLVVFAVPATAIAAIISARKAFRGEEWPIAIVPIIEVLGVMFAILSILGWRW